MLQLNTSNRLEVKKLYLKKKAGITRLFFE